MQKLAQLLGTVLTLLSSTGFTYFGVLGASIAIFLVSPKTVGWLGWILLGYFISHNITLLRPWAKKQWGDIKKKF
jgi:hypothetical protein